MDKRIIFVIALLLIVPFVNAAVESRTFRNGDYTIKWDTTNTLLKIENGWFGFNDMMVINSGTNCYPSARVGATTYEIEPADLVKTELINTNDYFLYKQFFYDANIGNYTLAISVTQDNDMYILFQEEIRPRNSTTFFYNRFEGTCFDFANLEPTQMYDGDTGVYTTANNIFSHDWTSYNVLSSFNYYGKILNGGTAQYTISPANPTTFTDFQFDTSGSMRFIRHAVNLLYDRAQSRLYMTSNTPLNNSVLVQSTVWAVNSNNPKLSPYYVERQKTRLPNELGMFGGGKLGSYDVSAGYSYNLLSLATYGAKYSSLYWNKPRGTDGSGYLIDRDLYRQSFYKLADFVDNGENFTTKYMYRPDYNTEPNYNGTPNKHYQMYDLASIGLFSAVGEMTLIKNQNPETKVNDEKTAAKISPISDSIKNKIEESRNRSTKPWGNYSWYLHSWVDQEPIVYERFNGMAGFSNSSDFQNITLTNVYYTEGTSALVAIQRDLAGDFGYIRHNFGVNTNFSKFRDIRFDINVPDLSKVEPQEWGIRLLLFDATGNSKTWYVRPFIFNNDVWTTIRVDLADANATTGAFDMDTVREWRIVVYDSDTGDFIYYLDNIYLGVSLQQSYVLNTHLEYCLMNYEMRKAGHDVEQSILDNCFNSIVHYLPTFENDQGDDSVFLAYRVWFSENPFYGVMDNDLSFAAYHYYSTFGLANFVEIVKAVEPYRDTSTIQETIRKACRWTVYKDTSGTVSNANTRYICPFILNDENITATYQALAGHPAVPYGEDVALMRSVVDFTDVNYVAFLHKVPTTNFIIVQQYPTSGYEIETRGLPNIIPTDKIIGLGGDAYRDFSILPNGEIRFYISNPLSTYKWKYFEILRSDTPPRVKILETEIPIKEINVTNNIVNITLDDVVCQNKQILVNPFCNAGMDYDITPTVANQWATFDIEGVKYEVFGQDSDGLCGFENVYIKSSKLEASCVSINVDDTKPTGTGGESDIPDSQGGGSNVDFLKDLGGLFSDGLGLSTGTKIFLAMIIIAVFVFIGARYGGAIGAIFLGVLAMLGTVMMMFLPLWIAVFLIVVLGLSIAILVTKLLYTVRN